MSSYKTTKQEHELKSAIMDEIETAVDQYLENFKQKSGNGKSLPTINEIEDMLSDLKSKTRDIYLSMVSDSISFFDESALIDSKKVYTEKEG